MKHLMYVLAFAACFVSSSSFSQSLYEVKFSDNNGMVYTGFIVYYNESESYMRVAYNDGVYHVVNVKYVATSGIENGTSYCVMAGYEPTFITGTQSEGYNPDNFVWIWTEGQESVLPYTSDDPAYDPNKFKPVDSYIELDPGQLTQEYLRQFYATDEHDYLAFLSMINDGGEVHTLHNEYELNDEQYETDEYNYATTTGENTTTESNSYENNTYENSTYNNNSNSNPDNTNNTPDISGPVTMHFVCVANTEIGDIGASCEADKRNLISEFEGVSEALKIKFKPYILDGKDFTRENVLRTINSVHAGKNDIILFVYTGHGFRWSDQTDQYPQMDLRYNSYQRVSKETCMGLSEVYDQMRQKGARLTVTFGDCCNSDIGVNARTVNAFPSQRSNPNFKDQKLQKLFLESKGNLIATAASPGEVSWSNSLGGFFINSFLQAFHEEISYLDDGDADWDSLIKA
ncbi:MAG TPA: hypothetical protein VD905_10475, partial [Flavobacteriales bacterium]|nr:hypothetical protein [Flavobacteriales bacterium]